MMERLMTIARSTVLCLLLVLPGCFGLNKGAPTQSHYVLGGHPEGAPRDSLPVVVREGAETPLIGLRTPRLADYLETPYIVVRRGLNQIDFSEFHRWGEDLARGANRTLASWMAERSPTHRIVAAPWPPTGNPEWVIQVQLLRFEGVAPEELDGTVGKAHLLASWEILDPDDGALLVTGTTEVRSDWTVGDFDRLVSLLDAALGRLAEDLILGLERVPPGSNGYPSDFIPAGDIAGQR